MEANKVKDSHRPSTDGGMAKEEFIRVEQRSTRLWSNRP